MDAAAVTTVRSGKLTSSEVVRVADRKHGIPAPSTTSTVHSADWDGRDLSGERHDKCDLRGSDLSSLDPETAKLKGAIIDPQQALVIAATLGLVVRED